MCLQEEEEVEHCKLQMAIGESCYWDQDCCTFYCKPVVNSIFGQCEKYDEAVKDMYRK